jgi:hypothetical protein
MTVEYKRMQQLRGSSAQWVADNIVPLDGELALERASASDARIKLGDGVTPYSSLPYLIPTPATSALGSINAVTTAPPAGASAGDFWMNTGTGTVIAGWGAPAAGLATVPGDQLLRSAAGTWSLIPMGSNLSGYARLADLAASTGAGLIGWIQTGAAAVLRSVLDKLREAPQTVRDRGAVSDGVADTRAAFVACDAVGAFVVPPGLYKIASSLTIASRVRFEPGARLVIGSGVTVTFNGGIDAPELQIFNLTGTGAVAGLRNCMLAWFIGDLVNSATDAESLVQKAYDACVPANGTTSSASAVYWPTGYFCTGGVGIAVTKGQRTIGRGKQQSWLLHLTPAANGLIHSVAYGPTVEGVCIRMKDQAMIATSGSQVQFQAGCGDNLIRGCEFRGGYIAKRWTGCNAGLATDANAYDSTGSADFIEGAANIQIANNNNSAFSDWFDLSTTVGFIPGEGLTWPGGTGQFAIAYSALRAKCIIDATPPVVGNTIHGAVSGTNATLVALTIPHAIGALKISDNSAAFIITGNEYSGGQYAAFVSATADAHGSRPEYGHVVGNYFDFTINGAIFDTVAGTGIVDNWFASKRGDGCTVNKATHCDLVGNEFSSSWSAGLFIQAPAKGTKVIGGYAAGNNRAGTGKPGIYVDAGTTDFVITGVRAGGATAVGYDGTQAYGIQIVVGASDRYIVEQNLIAGNTTAGVIDGGTGVNKSVARNY